MKDDVASKEKYHKPQLAVQSYLDELLQEATVDIKSADSFITDGDLLPTKMKAVESAESNLSSLKVTDEIEESTSSLDIKHELETIQSSDDTQVKEPEITVSTLNKSKADIDQWLSAVEVYRSYTEFVYNDDEYDAASVITGKLK